MTEEEYRAADTAQQNLTDASIKVMSESAPIPTQEELDLMRLGLMHVDQKADPASPEMPSVAVQQAYLESVDNAQAVPAPVAAPRRRPTAPTPARPATPPPRPPAAA